MTNPKDNSELLKFYREIVTVVDKSYSQKGHKALVVLQDYVNGAIVQYYRYTVDKESTPFNKERKERLLKAVGNKDEILKIIWGLADWTQILQLYLDVHFFLICADKVQNLIQYIAEADGDPKLKELAKKVRIDFKQFNEARNHFEHIHNEIRNESDNLGLSSTDGELFRFRVGKKWQDIHMNESTIRLIRDTYEELLTILKSRPDRVEEWRK